MDARTRNPVLGIGVLVDSVLRVGVRREVRTVEGPGLSSARRQLRRGPEPRRGRQPFVLVLAIPHLAGFPELALRMEGGM